MFKLLRHDIALGTSFNNDYLPNVSEAMADGEALVLTNVSGVFSLTKCGATAVPDFISNSVIAANTTPTQKVQAIHVLPEAEYETTSPAGTQIPASLIGQKVTLNTDGLSVTSTTTNGVFEITYTDAASNGGGIVRGRFRQ